MQRLGVREWFARENLEREHDEVLQRGRNKRRRFAVSVLFRYIVARTILCRIPRFKESKALLEDRLRDAR